MGIVALLDCLNSHCMVMKYSTQRKIIVVVAVVVRLEMFVENTVDMVEV